MQTDSSAMRTCIASESAVEWTATEAMPISRQARITRRAISPRLATRIFWNIGTPISAAATLAQGRGERKGRKRRRAGTLATGGEEPAQQGGGLRGADAAVAGYPLDGPYSVRPARVREVSEDVGTDIYGSVGPTRRTLVLRSRLDEGNSGGPLFNAYGEVVGLVFARSLEDRETGYAMTLDRVYPMVDGLGPRAAAVGTGPCLPGQQDDWG